MRMLIFCLLLSGLLSACDSRNSAVPKSVTQSPASNLAFDDEDGGAASTADDSLLRVHSRVAGTSHDGSEVDLVLTYTVDPSVQTALRSGSFVEFNYIAADQTTRVVARDSLDSELRGEVQVTVPTDDADATLVATFGGLQPGIVEYSGVSTVEIPVVQPRNVTDLSLVNEVSAELVPGSYQSAIENGRRIHRFAVRVTDPTAGPVGDLLNQGIPLNSAYSISGLEVRASNYFTALENGIDDTESPVTVTFEEHPLAVYMVIDASSSIVSSRQANNLANAVSTAIIELKENAQFDYRKFNGIVTRISSVRELDFDSGDSSATALYYAIDTALTDIENFGSQQQDKIVMVFTDGKDLASRNYYQGAFIDNDQVHEYIVQRVEQVKRAQSRALGRQLDVYTLAFYDDDTVDNVQAEVSKLDSIAEAGGTVHSYNNTNLDDIEAVFDAVVQNIRGVYYLEYSSQQTADDTCLQLQVSVNDVEPAFITLPNNGSCP